LRITAKTLDSRKINLYFSKHYIVIKM